VRLVIAQQSWANIGIVAGGGAVGTGLRYAISLSMLLLGLLTGLTTDHLVPQQYQLIIGTGLLGGYTTFSAASVETVRLLEDRRYAAATFHGLGMLIGCTAAAALGYAVALLITS
jgi:protein CrcB